MFYMARRSTDHVTALWCRARGSTEHGTAQVPLMISDARIIGTGSIGPDSEEADQGQR
jgi:hypothetical protein